MEPKIIEVPGIPGKLQEMTLDQYLAALPADHLARKQLDEIRAQALKAVELSTQLMQANEKIMDLQNKLILGIAPQPPIPAPQPHVQAPEPAYFPPEPSRAADLAVKAGFISDPSKFVCNICAKELNSITGLQRHLHQKHQAEYRIKGHALVPIPAPSV